MIWQRCAPACVGIALMWMSLAACSNEPRNCPPTKEQGTPVDATLMAFLSRARAAHHLADLQEETQPRQAISTLTSLIDGPIPRVSGVLPTEVREVMADTQARIADLLSREKNFDSALDRIASTLDMVQESSYFRGHLFETRGLVEQRRAEELNARGEPRLADAAKTRALQAFETAMQIQAEVIRSTPTLEDSSRSGPTHPSRSKPEDASGQDSSPGRTP